MKELKKLKTVFTPFKKNVRPVLAQAKVDEKGLHLTDLETFITIKNTFDLSKGLHPIETVTLLNKPSDIDIEEYPCHTWQVDELSKYTVKCEDLKSLLEFASKDETRLYLNGVCFDQQNLVACDGYTLKNIKVTYSSDTKETFIVPSTVIKHLLKLAKIHKLDELTLIFDERLVKVETDHFLLVGRLIERDYPKWITVIPTKTDKAIKVTNWINFKELKELFNKRGACRVFSENGKVYLSPCETIASDQRFEIGISNDEFEVGFNVTLLDRLLKNSKGTLEFKNELSPFMMRDENIIKVVMPLKL